ncbi:MAG: pyrimidine 5'-nucleotidase [Rhodospirillales bacterium]|nr:pyrimidine 5'-nucleotidase [Rhodospirillales bacterium]
MDQINALNTNLLQAECWVFDLDNTLYPATSDIFAQVDEKMTLFIAEFLSLGLEAAGKLRKDYYLEHGTTMAGLMAHHGLKPGKFLDYVHDIDLSTVSTDKALDEALSRLAGRKIIFTNGPADHAGRILDKLAVRHHFDAVFDIIIAGYIPKPKPEAYDALVEMHGLKPDKTVMVEDLARNLGPAAALGMTTVWVRQNEGPDVTKDPDAPVDHVHHIVDDLVPWLAQLTA